MYVVSLRLMLLLKTILVKYPAENLCVYSDIWKLFRLGNTNSLLTTCYLAGGLAAEPRNSIRSKG